MSSKVQEPPCVCTYMKNLSKYTKLHSTTAPLQGQGRTDGLKLFPKNKTKKHYFYFTLVATVRTVWSRVCAGIQIPVDIVKVVVCYLVHLDLIDRGSIILQASFDRRVFSCRGFKQISESFGVDPE